MSNIITQTLSYTDSQGVTLQSHFCYPSDATQAVPAVLVAPEWWGLSEHAKHSAERLAAAGYAALAMDLYGNALLTDNGSIANDNMMYLLNHPEVLAERTRLAREALQAQTQVNRHQMAAIGFCFGGKVVLDMARRGEALQAVCSFHGNLSPAQAAQAGVIQAEILVEHGELDTLTTLDDVAAFRAEMDNAGVRYHIDIFPQAKHGFTNPQATANGQKNGVDFLDYHPEAAEAAWQNMLNLLAKTFA